MASESSPIGGNPEATTARPPRVTASEAALRTKADAFVAELANLRPGTRYRSEFRASLNAVVQDLEVLCDAAEQAAGDASPFDALSLDGTLQAALESWRRVTSAVEVVVARALRREVDGDFRMLSPLANAGNMRGQQRLSHCRARLALAAASACPSTRAPETEESSTVSGAAESAVGRPPAAAEPSAVAPVTIAESLPPGARAKAAELRPVAGLAPEPHAVRAPRVPGDAGSLDYVSAFGEPHGHDRDPQFEQCLARLLEADDIDRNDAVLELIRTHVHRLLACLIRREPADRALSERALRGLWRNAELVLLDDYFYSSRRSKLTWLLTLAEPPDIAERFRALLRFFLPGAEYAPAEPAFQEVAEVFAEDAPIFVRAALFHPLESYRRRAADILPVTEVWTVVAFPNTPPAALLTIVQRLARPDVAEDYRKVFFDCTARTLANASGLVQLRAARQILDVLYEFEFFMEDDYFKRLDALAEIIGNHEELSGIDSPLFSHSEKILREQKARVGARQSRHPDFSGIPLTVQRKLARDGHYLYLFVRHDDPRIARETVPHITTPERIGKVLQTPRVNALVLANLGQRDHVRNSYSARLAFLKQLRAPVTIAQRYITTLRPEDLRSIALARDLNPDVAALARIELKRKGLAPRPR